MQDVHAKLNPGLPLHKQYSTERILFTSKLHKKLRRKLVKRFIWSTALCGAEKWTLWKVDQKYLESFEMWCWRRMKMSVGTSI
jgi:hypothetical protein